MFRELSSRRLHYRKQADDSCCSCTLALLSFDSSVLANTANEQFVPCCRAEWYVVGCLCYGIVGSVEHLHSIFE